MLPSLGVVASPYVIVGRGSDCALVIADSSVSHRHARLSWRNGLVLIEDLGSANGVWVAGRRVASAAVRPGDDVRIGGVPMPWSRRELRPFLRLGAKGTELVTPWFHARRLWRRLVAGLVLLGGVAGAVLLVAMLFPGGREAVRGTGERVQTTLASLRPARTDEEAYVRARLATGVARAIDPADATVRSEAVKIAARRQGEFRVEQVAAIWGHARARWRYVNDPRGREYFATAKETIDNGYAGDCDDFAIALAAMVGAIGGEARVVFMEGPRGGHAYAEACIAEAPATVASKLLAEYSRRWPQLARGRRAGQIAYRHDASCPVWLNLDWNANLPGGDYAPERWAVAVHPDGSTETLAPAAGTPESAQASSR